MQITLLNLVELVTAEGADEVLLDIPLNLVALAHTPSEPVRHHLRWPKLCEARGARDAQTQRVRVGDVLESLCPSCASEEGSVRGARSGSLDLVEGWVSAHRWLAKPSRAGGETQVRRVTRIENVLRDNPLVTRGHGEEAWRGVVLADLRAKLPALAGRLGSREEALALARAVVAAEVGGDDSLLDETPMLVRIAEGLHTPTVEALRRQCRVGSGERHSVLLVPMWAVSYLLGHEVRVCDLASAGEDQGVIETAVALHEPHSRGPHALLCAALASARDALAP